jgi:hypothetical protein
MRRPLDRCLGFSVKVSSPYSHGNYSAPNPVVPAYPIQLRLELVNEKHQHSRSVILELEEFCT